MKKTKQKTAWVTSKGQVLPPATYKLSHAPNPFNFSKLFQKIHHEKILIFYRILE